ncbi:bifunctional 3'-5' exonuclease/DNA polymerase [Arthrobacter sp. GMC3]|uniref:bifunctional 3'-5' exonuclease/DNA polymerase n=1 Tax=Arthrobacter sp. GMC3 TaxID=2058894 RepID=UPI000CE45007|nr:bifunctional 3'-5' exonuclease/DNA polymerase [Arthrobacter sp. GMC3]
MYALVASAPENSAATIQLMTAEGILAGPAQTVARSDLAGVVSSLEREHAPRWVWDRAQNWYPELLAANVRVERCHDLALRQAILVHSAFTAETGYGDNAAMLPPENEASQAGSTSTQGSLFEQLSASTGWDLATVTAELGAQKAAIASSTHPARLTLLTSAESACALVAAEMQYEGIPWREDLHRRLLHELLGPEPTGYVHPEKMDELAATLRAALDAPALNPDSPQELMRALHRAGIDVKSTRSWELMEFKHPAIEPLLAYRKLSRLFTTNGWTWLEQWVHQGRFHSEYVVGGVVSGRWASRGGGAMQIPKQIRGAARADPGHKFIVADAAQLEPRVLAALAQDSTMAAAGRDSDLYAGIAAQGFGGERDMAKVALLGAIYGSTSGESGRLMPQLTRMYPLAVGFVEEAARAGERGETVTTRLGRSTPPVSAQWRASQRSSTAEEQRRAESAARTRGRFTRNFVVQGTAAEWACCWLAELRRRLRALPLETVTTSGTQADRPAMVFFLHDEVMVHCPDALIEVVTKIVHDSSRAATRLLFGEIPLEFPVNVTVVENYADAK